MLSYARPGDSRCPSRVQAKDENGRPYTPGCDLIPNHGGSHYHGHFRDVMWSWSDEDEMR